MLGMLYSSENELELHLSTGIKLISIMVSEESKLHKVQTELYYLCEVVHIV